MSTPDIARIILILIAIIALVIRARDERRGPGALIIAIAIYVMSL